MTGQRALILLQAFADPAAPRDDVTAREIDELLSAGLLTEADRDDVALLEWLVPVIAAYLPAGLVSDGAPVIAALEAAHRELHEDLQSDWYRMTRGAETIREAEGKRATLRRALAVARDGQTMARLAKLTADRAALPAQAQYLPCALGDELYAVTKRGHDVASELAVRIARYRDAPLASFVKAYDKATGKLAAFASDVGRLARGIGSVRKNQHQVVIGLVKSGLAVDQALASFHGVNGAQAPGDAVAATRAAATTGGDPRDARKRLNEAIRALAALGLKGEQAANAAKTLLPFEPLAAGAQRFSMLYNALIAAGVRGDATYKCAARLMPARGEPAAILDRARTAWRLVGQHPSASGDPSPALIGVALAAMVDDANDLGSLVTRFREIERALIAAGISGRTHAETDALECVACPGTPTEVVATVAAIIVQLPRGAALTRGEVAIAVAFAKRFAY